jgi:hypothetical protein
MLEFNGINILILKSIHLVSRSNIRIGYNNNEHQRRGRKRFHQNGLEHNAGNKDSTGLGFYPPSTSLYPSTTTIRPNTI